MEVLKSGDAPSLVSNLEVMQLLQERMAARQSQENGSDVNSKIEQDNGIQKGPFQNRDWIEQTVLNHLQSSPVGGSDVKLEDMPKLVEQLRRDPGADASIESASANATEETKLQTGYGLTNAETLQIINHLPSSLVEVHLLIEDIEKRGNLEEEEKHTQFLRLISEFSGVQIEEGDDDGDDGEGDGGEVDEDGK
mmetsp:Transcript_40491/g.69051  ORF Transcript_40491/g.69051 Transcript_40491/m.69051 type:complete len:194 (-) Transcript_40491:796-1377(-)